VNGAAGGVLECRRGSIFVRGKFFARQNLSMRASLRLQRPVPARSKPGQAIVEFLKRSVQRLKPPTCDLCHEPMVWFNSVRQGTTDMISHFFHVLALSQRQRGDSETRNARQQRQTSSERRALAQDDWRGAGPAHALKSKEKSAGTAASSDFSRRIVCYLVSYLVRVAMRSNVALRVEPMALTVETITIEMPAAMMLYSIAVAPDSSFRNEKTRDMRHALPVASAQ
jgi:hypothetical protein